MSRLVYTVGMITALGVSSAFSQHLEISVQTGHKLSHAAEFSSDGKLMITAGGNVAILWDTESGAEIRVFSGHTGEVTTASFSPDGAQVLTGSLDGTVRLWNAATGKEEKRIVPARALLTVKGEEVDGFQGVSSAAFSADGRRIVIGGLDGRAHVWDLQSGRQTAELITDRGNSLAESDTCAAFSSDARQVLTSSVSTDVQLWDVQSGKELVKFRAANAVGHSYSRTASLPGSPVAPVIFLPQGGLAVTGGRDEAPRLWETVTGREVIQFPTALYGCHSIAISKDGTQLATGGQLKLWDLRSGRLILKYPRAGNLQLDAQGQLVGVSSGTEDAQSVAFSPDGSALLIVDGSESASMWDTRSAKLIRTFKAPVQEISSLQFSEDGNKLVTNGPHVWNLQNGEVVTHLNITDNLPVALSPNGDQLATSVGNQLFLFDMQTGAMTLKFESQPELKSSVDMYRDAMSGLYQPGYTPQNFDVKRILFSRSGNRILTTAGPLSDDNIVRVWDTTTGKKVLEFRGHQDADKAASFGIRCATFSQDGTAVLTSGRDKIVRLWDASSGRELLELKTYWRTPDPGMTGVWEEDFRSDIKGVAFSPDGTELITGGDAVDVWQRATGRKVLHIESNATALAVSRQGAIATSGWGENIVRLWDLGSGKKLTEMRGHAGTVQAMAFSPDGQVLASGSEDGAIRLWSVANGALLAALINFSDGGWIVTDPQGRFDTDSLDRGAPIRWVVSDEPFRALPVEIFMQQFYTPNLLSKILKHDALPAVPDIAKLNRIQPLVEPPSVEPDPAGAGLVRVRVKVSAQLEHGRTSGARGLRLFRDGRMVGIRSGDHLAGEYTFSGIRLPQHNTVEFSAYAFNSEYVKSETAKTAYEVPRPLPPHSPRTYLLGIGVSQNQAVGCTLDHAASDAVATASALGHRLPAVEQTLVVSDGLGHSATKQAIRAALSEIGKKITPDDLFIMTFSGHGYTDKNGVFYLFPSDFKGSCNEVPNDQMLHSAIATSELTEWLRPLDAGEMVMILDACHSAASVEAAGFRPGPMGNRGLGQLAYDKRMRILGASQPQQLAIESRELQMGLLTAALVKEGLEANRADWKPPDGKIQLREWLEYAVERVPKMYVEDYPQYKKEPPQQPALFDFTGKNNAGIELALHRFPASPLPDRVPAQTTWTQSSPPPGPETNPQIVVRNNTQGNLAVLTVTSAMPGYPNPLGRIPFSLMRDDLSTTLQSSGIQVRAGSEPPEAFRRVCRANTATCDTRLLRASITGAASSQTSDLNGNAILPPVTPGDYYILIYGYDSSRRLVYWHEKITLKAGINSFTASAQNARPLR